MTISLRQLSTNFKLKQKAVVMKKILGIIGSPRKLGNCEIMVKEIGKHLSVPHELQLLRLSEFDILPCRGCYHCLLTSGNCVLGDDLNSILTAVTEADALIVSAPTYFLGLNATVKRLLDRGLSFYHHFDKLWNKPALGIVVAGIEGKEGYSLLAMQSFLKLIFADIKNTCVIFGALPGEIFLDETNRQAAARLAGDLFNPTSAPKAYGCSQCGGDTFRFLGDNRVRCMLCSNDGMLTMDDNEPKFNIEKSEHEFFLTRKDAMDHKAWLLEMKDRFVQQKKALKGITLSYAGQGKWIKPEPSPDA
jgi:multimeric flavodoxin WrbA